METKKEYLTPFLLTPFLSFLPPFSSDFEIVDFIGEVSGIKEGDNILIFFCTTKQDFKLMEPEKFSEWRWVPKNEYIENEIYCGFNPVARKLIVDYLKN